MPRANSVWKMAPLVALLALWGCPSATNKKNIAAQKGTGVSAEPDKVLYERANEDLRRNRYDEARLALQTLINTYPDSDYLAKAKLGMADSFFKQGGAGELTQAIAQYQDFITFFPFLDEAAYAQMQVGMAHFRRMEKPDRDRDEAIEAEGALQTFLQKYPNSKLFSQAQQRLREVQEVLAEGDFRVAYFYYVRHADRASATRLNELVTRYPLYSQADRANWMIGTLAERTERNDIAGQYYLRIVKDYPLSPLAAQAKAKLERFGVPVPQPDPTALARMQAEQQIPRERRGILSAPKGMLKSAPNVSMAAHSGTPTMTPPDTESGDIMTPGSLSLGNPGASAASSGSPTGGTGAAIVETVTPGSSATAPADASAGSAPAAESDPPAASGATDSTTPAASGTTTGDTAQPAADAAATPASTNTTPQAESSSKKKKGLKKLIPF